MSLRDERGLEAVHVRSVAVQAVLEGPAGIVERDALDREHGSALIDVEKSVLVSGGAASADLLLGDPDRHTSRPQHLVEAPRLEQLRVATW